MIHITDTMENLSDETCSLMHTVKKFVTDEKYRTDSKRSREIMDYIERVRIFFEQVCVYFTIGFSAEERNSGEIIEQRIDETKKELKKESRKRLEAGADVKEELNYMDMVRKIERAGDCVYGILQSL